MTDNPPQAASADAGDAAPENVDWAVGEPEAVDDAIKTPREGDLEGYRETTRAQLAKWLMALLTITVLVLLGLAVAEILGAKNKSGISLENVAQVSLTPVVTLTGTALGFYFGAQTANEGKTSSVMPVRRQPGKIRSALRWLW